MVDRRAYELDEIALDDDLSIVLDKSGRSFAGRSTMGTLYTELLARVAATFQADIEAMIAAALVGMAEDRLFELQIFLPDKPAKADDGPLVRFVMAHAVAIPSGFTDARATALTAATAETVLSLRKNGVEIGTVTFAASGTTGTVAGAAGLLVAGDLLEIYNQAVQDTTLADISLALVGVRS